MKWEITQGRADLDWKSSREWWVMVWGRNGDAKVPMGPIHVHDMQLQYPYLVMERVPGYAHQFAQKDTHCPYPDWVIPVEHVWARMPAPKPPATPNVQMMYLKEPWEEATEPAKRP